MMSTTWRGAALSRCNQQKCDLEFDLVSTRCVASRRLPRRTQCALFGWEFGNIHNEKTPPAATEEQRVQTVPGAACCITVQSESPHGQTVVIRIAMG
jgi:hypothetical protein